MKTTRQAKILELIQKKDVETQEELSAYLEKEGFQVTQATVSRDIRELKLTKISTDNGRQKYAVITDADSNMMEKYARVLREGFLSVDAAENIVVIKNRVRYGGSRCGCSRCHAYAGDCRLTCGRRHDSVCDPYVR